MGIVHGNRAVKNVAPEQEDARSLLNSEEAKDLGWYFRWAATAFGFKAQAIETTGLTLGKGVIPLWDLREELLARYPGLELLFAFGNPMGPVKSRQLSVGEPERITDRNLSAVRRERRIRTALTKLEPVDFHILRLAYEGKRHSAEIHEALGDFADLAMHMPRAREAYAKYVLKFKPKKLGQQPYSLETWLVILQKHGDPLLPPLRDDVEAAVSSALEAYARLAEPPSREELPPPPPPRPRKKRGPRVERGIPFLPSTAEADATAMHS